VIAICKASRIVLVVQDRGKTMQTRGEDVMEMCWKMHPTGAKFWFKRGAIAWTSILHLVIPEGNSHYMQ